MNSSIERRSSRWFRRPVLPEALLIALTAASVLAIQGDTSAQDSLPTVPPVDTPIIRIEEDWVVEIGTPDPNDHAPQIVGVISPTGNLNGVHAVFELNHATQPEYVAGGMQLQRWNGEDNLDYCFHSSDNLLSFENEVIHYTMAMQVSDGVMRFDVINGTSESWGPFGEPGQLQTSVPTNATSLSGYSPLTSTQHSRVGYASHRVKKYALKQVRYYSAAGLVATDTVERSVHQYDPEE